MTIFNSYVKVPEGILFESSGFVGAMLAGEACAWCFGQSLYIFLGESPYAWWIHPESVACFNSTAAELYKPLPAGTRHIS